MKGQDHQRGQHEAFAKKDWSAILQVASLGIGEDTAICQIDGLSSVVRVILESVKDSIVGALLIGVEVSPVSFVLLFVLY